MANMAMLILGLAILACFGERLLHKAEIPQTLYVFCKSFEDLTQWKQ